MSPDGDSNMCLSIGICPIYSLTISNGKVKSMTARNINNVKANIRYDSPNIIIWIYSEFNEHKRFSFDAGEIEIDSVENFIDIQVNYLINKILENECLE